MKPAAVAEKLFRRNNLRVAAASEELGLGKLLLNAYMAGIVVSSNIVVIWRGEALLKVSIMYVKSFDVRPNWDIIDEKDRRTSRRVAADFFPRTYHVSFD